MAINCSNQITRSNERCDAPKAVLFVIQFVIVFFLGLTSTSAYSQSNNGSSISIGESNLIPSIRFEYSQDNNALRRNADELDNTSVIIKPELLWSADRGLTSLSLKYSGDISSGDLEQLDYDDHTLAFDVKTGLSKRSRIRANARVASGHLELGRDVFTRENPDALQQVEFNQQSIDLVHTYGAAQAKGQFITSLNVDNRDFTNNDALTRNSSRLIFRPSIAFSYRISGDTRGFVSASLTEVDRAANGRDRTDFDLALGASWDITGRSGGSASFGLGQSSLDNAEDQSEFVSEVGLYYQPRSFSRFDLEFQRGFFNDGSGTTNEVAVNDSLNVAWNYDWSSRVKHTLSAAFRNVDRACPDVGDQTANLRLEFNVQVRRWVSIGFGIDSEQRESDSCSGTGIENTDLGYERQTGFAFLTFQL